MGYKKTALLISIFLLAALLAGCSSGFTRTQAAKGGRAPDFKLQTLEGGMVSLSSLRGKPVFINFWATWCLACREEMPYLQQAYDIWRDRGLQFLTVDIQESPAQIEGFMKSNNLSMPVLLDSKGTVAEQYQVRVLPTTFLIDRNGIIQYVKYGPYRSAAEIAQTLETIMP